MEGSKGKLASANMSISGCLHVGLKIETQGAQFVGKIVQRRCPCSRAQTGLRQHVPADLGAYLGSFHKEGCQQKFA